MRILCLISFLFVLLAIPNSSFAWIPEYLDLTKDQQIEPSLRPNTEIQNSDNLRTPASTTPEVKTQNTPEPETLDNEIFEFRLEHMNYILENI